LQHGKGDHYHEREEKINFLPIGYLSYANPNQSIAVRPKIPVQGFTFDRVFNIFREDVDAIQSVYTVPENRIVVITDIHIALNTDASGTHRTFVTNEALQPKAGYFLTTPSSTFTHSYTSGIILGSGQQIVLSDIGGTGNVMVNRMGFLACRDTCD
jgi:hypothetical protein